MIELQFARLQTALFLTSLDMSKKLDLAVAIRHGSGGLLDADVVMLPIPPGAPIELPRLQLKSSDGYWSCQVASNRLDLVFELPPDKLGSQDSDNVIQLQAQIGSAIWEAIQAQYNASGNRIGIVSLFFGLADNPVDILRTRFLQSSNAPVPHQLQLHTLHKIIMENVPINRWTRCSAGELTVGDKVRNALRVEIDVNTLSEENFTLNPERISSFTSLANGLALTTLASLFEDEPHQERVF